MKFASLSLFAVAAVLLVIPIAASQAGQAVLLVSIDGLRPDYILKADKHGLKIPNLRALVHEGTYATSVQGVLPSATYPSHTTIITGVFPAKHGIVGNKPFGGAVKDLDVWYTYAWDIRVPTLWDAATQAGYKVGSVSWPVTVGATSIAFNIPEFNLTRTAVDVQLTRGAATPGLMAELAERAGPYITDVADATKRDWARTHYAVELLRKKHPRFLTVHLAATDHIQHRNGPFAASLWPALEEIDQMIGELRSAMLNDDANAVVCIVSDHGFAPVTKILALDAALVKAGFIILKGNGPTVASAGIVNWTAQSWSVGGSSAIVLKNPNDVATREKVKTFLHDLAVDPTNGIAAIFDEEAIRQWGGTPTAQFWVDMQPGFMVSEALQPTVVSVVSARGTHGYAPTHAEMGATFIIAGKGIVAGQNLGRIDMRSIAPTLARVLGVSFPSADVAAQEIFYGKE